MLSPFLLVVMLLTLSIDLHAKPHVKVLHFMIPHWGEMRFGNQHCKNVECEWFAAERFEHLKWNYEQTMISNGDPSLITLTLYNIHSWWERTRTTIPDTCGLQTNLTMAETEESKVRYFQLFDQSFRNFDGFSSTSNESNVQRVYVEAKLNESEIYPRKNFSSLIKGASYVASDCHKRDTANANRDGVVHMIRLNDFRVDGLGRCMATPVGPEGIQLWKSRDTRYNLNMKREAIGHYMFNLAFENSLEPGYVTEKPFDALIAGTVPVYLGDAAHLKTILPHPKAAIFVADFENITALADYLKYLTTNETAYEEHRSWYLNFTYESNIKDKPLLQESWQCHVCQWALVQSRAKSKHMRLCPEEKKEEEAKKEVKDEVRKAPDSWNGRAVRGSARQVYLVKNGVLHGIPDLDTFYSLKLKLEEIQVVDDADMKKLMYGEMLPRAY